MGVASSSSGAAAARARSRSLLALFHISLGLVRLDVVSAGMQRFYAPLERIAAAGERQQQGEEPRGLPPPARATPTDHSAASSRGFARVQRSAAALSVSLAATQAAPSGRSSRFQNGACVLR